MINKNVLALDLATKAGWAIRTHGGAVLSGTFDAKTTKGAHVGQRFINFRTFLADLIKEHDVDAIAFEDVRRHIGTTAAHVHGGLRAIMEMMAAYQNITPVGLSVGTIKKSWTGNGSAKKDAMILEAFKRGYRVKDDNEADALAILDLMLLEHGGIGRGTAI